VTGFPHDEGFGFYDERPEDPSGTHRARVEAREEEDLPVSGRMEAAVLQQQGGNQRLPPYILIPTVLMAAQAASPV
jgi:hypothetical protein